MSKREQRKQRLASAASLALGTLPIVEAMGLPLRDLLRLCETDKSFYERCAVIMGDILKRVEVEDPALLLGFLRHVATAPLIDDRLREACIRRLQWRKTISVGSSHALALLDDGSVVGWGDDRALHPTERGRYVSVSAGFLQSVALLDNGRLVKWGDVNLMRLIYLPPAPPAGHRYVSVSAAGGYNSLALLDNGDVRAWGSELFGHVTNKDAALRGRRCVAVADGWSYSLALLEDGQVVGWGRDDVRQATGAAGALPAGRRYIAISAGSSFGVGLLDNGEIAVWGSEAVVNDARRVNQEVRNRGRRFVNISAGSLHALGLLDSGEVVGWGEDNNGQSSGGGTALAASEGNRYVAIAAGTDLSMGLVDNGRIVFWGTDKYVKVRVVEPPPGRTFVW